MAKINIKTYTVGVDAGNDNNGNPRRGWFVYDKTGKYLGFIDHEYVGRAALRALGNNIELSDGLGITVSTYRGVLKESIV